MWRSGSALRLWPLPSAVGRRTLLARSGAAQEVDSGMSNGEFERIVEALPGALEARRAFPSVYDAGRDAALNGPTMHNCHLCWFATPESRELWERGHQAGREEAARRRPLT